MEDAINFYCASQELLEREKSRLTGFEVTDKNGNRKLVSVLFPMGPQ